MSGIIWVASFPKSGNTWLRIVLTNLMAGGASPVDINTINQGVFFHSADRRYFDESLGFEASDLTHDEVDAIRPDFYRQAAARAAGPVLCKVHDAFVRLSDGRPLFPPDVTRGAVYIIRNPLDVCVSWAHHAAVEHEAVAAGMADRHLAF